MKCDDWYEDEGSCRKAGDLVGYSTKNSVVTLGTEYALPRFILRPELAYL